MKFQHDVILSPSTSDFMVRLHNALGTKEIRVQMTAELSEIPQLIKSTEKPILVVDVGQEEAAFEKVKLLITMKPLFEAPLVVLGQDAENFEGILNRYFRIATTLSMPCETADVIKALDYLSDVYPEPEPAKTATLKPKESEGTTEPKGAQLYEGYASVPSLVFTEMYEHDLSSFDFQARDYIRGHNEKRLTDQSYLPTSETALRIIHTVSSEVGRWARAHLHRVGFLSHKIHSALSLSTEVRESGKVAAFLFAWAFSIESEPLLRRPLDFDGDLESRREMMWRIKESARRISEELGLKRASEIVTTLSRLIGREEDVSDEPISIAASAIMAADLIDRICWRSGYWDSRTVSLILRNLKRGGFSDLHPGVLSCIVKFLSEALRACHSGKKKNRDTGQRRLLEENELRVPIDSMSPGLTLTRPINTDDGAPLLEPGAALDEDLIWRLWQLSSIRPLASASIVVSNHKKKKG